MTSAVPSVRSFANLGLSPNQNLQVNTILQNAGSGGLSFSQVAQQIESLLSPAQLQTFSADLQSKPTATNGQQSPAKTGALASPTSTTIGTGSDAFGVATSAFTDLAAVAKLVNPFAAIAASFAAKSQLGL